MSITAYTGIPGSGKSYSVVKNVILPQLRESKSVVTNIPMTEKALKEFPGMITQFKTEEVKENPAWFQEVFVPGATLVFDEVWELWPSGLRANNMQDGHKRFIAEHRHMVGEDGRSTQIVLVVQDLGNICTYVRNMVESTYRSEKLKSVGMDKRFRIDIYNGPVSGPKPPKTALVSQRTDKYESKFYDYYQSQTQNLADGHGVEETIDKRINVFNSPFFRTMLPAVFIVCGLIIYYGFGRVKSFYGVQEDDIEEPVAAAAPGALPDQVPTQAAPKEVQHFYDGFKAHISFNMGTRPGNTRYLLTFIDGDYRVTLDQLALLRLGYDIEPISQCLVFLVGKGGRLAVTCKSEDEASPVTLNL